MINSLKVKRKDGEIIEIKLRELKLSDINKIIKLQELIINGLENKELYADSKREEFEEYINCNGKIKLILYIVTHKDRFIRFGYDWFERFLSKYNVKIIVVNNELLSPKEELAQDIISILHVFSCRIYGLRKYKKKIKRDEEIAKSLQSRDKTNSKTNTENQSKYWSL